MSLRGGLTTVYMRSKAFWIALVISLLIAVITTANQARTIGDSSPTSAEYTAAMIDSTEPIQSAYQQAIDKLDETIGFSYMVEPGRRLEALREIGQAFQPLQKQFIASGDWREALERAYPDLRNGFNDIVDNYAIVPIELSVGFLFQLVFYFVAIRLLFWLTGRVRRLF